MLRRWHRLGLAAALAAGLCPATVEGQQAWTGARVESYHFADPDLGLDRVQLVSFPWQASMDVTGWSGLWLSGGFGQASVTSADGETSTVSGLSDTQVGFQARWGHATANAMSRFATGSPIRNVEEAVVAGTLVTDILPFELVPLGSTAGMGGELAFAFRVGRSDLAFAAGYSSIEQFDAPDRLGDQYAPGRRTHARIAIDSGIGAAGVVSAVVGFQRFGADEVDGRKLMTPGDRVQATVSFAFPVGARESASVFVGAAHREGGKVGLLPGGSPTPIEALLPGSSLDDQRSLMLVGAETRFFRSRLEVGSQIEARALRSVSGVGQGWLASLFGHATYRAWGGQHTSRIILEPAVGLRFGKVVARRDLESHVLGWRGALTARWLWS